MRYIKVFWHHSHPDYPVVLYSELDDGSWETRKVEVFRQGSCTYADSKASNGSARLGIEPVPSLDEIARNPEFEPTEISRDEFEDVWRNAISRT